MGVSALDQSGEPVIAGNVPAAIWESWKGASADGRFRMPCSGPRLLAHRELDVPEGDGARPLCFP
jgi:hypothetical protein